MQLNLFDKVSLTGYNSPLLNDLFHAYYYARKNKRNTINQLKFEIEYEHNIFELYDEIFSQLYHPKPSICFIVDKPVMREIFAADFSDRVVHHLIYNYIAPVFEKTFINDSYSCRKGKGTHYGIKRISRFIRSCSDNYTKDCYILKLDVKGYFMSMNKDILYGKVKKELTKPGRNFNFDLPLVLSLIEKTIFNDPTINCIIKGNKNDWNGLPKTKSLFHASKNCGLPIGNLTSQLFGNVYMNSFDHWIRRELGIKYYGRYVDDFVLIHQDKNILQSIIPRIAGYLDANLKLTLHPDKIYLQHYSKGLKYLGTVIKPHRIYIANRTKGNFYQAIAKQNRLAPCNKPCKEKQTAFLSSMNSYLGILKHYKTHKLRKKMISNNLHPFWWNYFYLTVGIYKFVLKKRKCSVNC